MEKVRKDLKEAGAYAHIAAIVATLALIVALVGSVTSAYVAHRDNGHLKTVAISAQNAASAAKKAAKAARTVGLAKRNILHAQDIKSCKSRHKLAHAFLAYLEDGVKQNERLLNTPAALRGLSPQLVQNARRSLGKSRMLLDDLHAADCDPSDPRDVLPLK